MRLTNLYKAPKGLLRIEAEVENGVIADIRITGDFFMIPEGSLASLELGLRGVRLSQDAVSKAVSDFYKSGVSTPMLSSNDIVNAILGAKNGN
jgi:hypothetical protein